MRIAVVSDCYAPRMGGIEAQLAGLAPRLRAAGHEVLVLTATPGPAAPGVLRLPSPVPVGAPVNPWAWPALRTALTSADLAHVHLGVMAPFAHMGTAVAGELGIPTVVTWHSLVSSSALTALLRGRWRGWVERGVLPSAVSTVAAAQLSTHLRGAHVEVLGNGIDLQQWRPVDDPDDPSPPGRPDPSTPPAHPGPLRVVSAMRFTPRKRPTGLISMVSTARASLPAHLRPHLRICGDGPLLGPLRQRVAATSLREWVELPGRLHAAELADTYRGSDVYVAPARHEAFGIAALEAAAAGLPVLAYRGSGVRDVIDGGGTGQLVDSDREMVGCLTDLANRPEQVSVLAQRVRSQPPTDHDWPAVGRSTIALYERAIGGA